MKPDPLTSAFLRAARLKIKEIHREWAGDRLKIGLFAFGGHGDLMRLMTFAAAVRKRYPRERAHITLICKYINPTYHEPSDRTAAVEGWAVNDEIIRMVALQPEFAIDHVVQLHLVRWEHAVRALRPRFDHFWEVQYVAGLTTTWRNRKRPSPWSAFQAKCNRQLKPWRGIFDGFAHSNPKLNGVGMTQFETLAASSGLDVREDDLRIEVERHGDGTWRFGGRAWEPIVKLPEQPYVVWHNGAGGRAAMKCLPLALANEGVRVCRKAGLTAVQVGRRDKDILIDGVADYRGCSICDTAALLSGSVGHFDIEGGIVYLSHALGVPRCVFFGPTPTSLFGFKDSLNCSREVCEPCWWSVPDWDRKCKLGQRFCLNMPQTLGEMGVTVSLALRTFKEVGRW